MSVRFGISLLLPEQLTSLPARLPAHLQMAEFPGDALDTAGGLRKLAALAGSGVRLLGRDFITPEIAGLIPGENCKIRAELEAHFSRRCALAAECGAKEFSVAFELFQAVDDPVYREKLAVFLRRCAGVIHGSGQRMRLVCRIPCGNRAVWEDILNFRNSLLLPGIDLLLELHPHEPHAPEIMNAALKTFRFHDDCRRVCYDSSSGNVLTAGALKRCAATFFRGPEPEIRIFLSPGTGKFDAFRLAGLEDLAASFTGAGEKQETAP